jgi:hypothetical protein
MIEATFLNPFGGPFLAATFLLLNVSVNEDVTATVAGEAEKGLAKKSPRRIRFNPTTRSHEQRRASG